MRTVLVVIALLACAACAVNAAALGKSAGALEPVAAPVANPISLAAPVATAAVPEAALIAITPAAPSAAPIAVTPVPAAPAPAPAAPAPAAPAPVVPAGPLALPGHVTVPAKVAQYVAHGRNPKQKVDLKAFKKRRAEWLKRKAEKEKLAGPAAPAAPNAAAPGAAIPAAAAVVGAPRFMQLPSAAHDAELLRTLEAVMDRSPAAAGSITEVEHDTITYNADSPLSAVDKKILEQTHSQVSVKNALLHDQETLDRAQLQLDDANKQRAELLAQYPVADSLLQFSSHN